MFRVASWQFWNLVKSVEIYHLSPDEGVSVRHVVETVCQKLDVNFADAVDVVDERPGQDAAYVIDSSKARQELGWASTIGFSEGIDDVIQWVDENWEELRTESWDYEHKA